MRQLLGVIFLAFIPGLLILYILRLNKLELAEKIVLTVGISIAFLMLFGLLLNQISLWFGYTSPLSTNFLTIVLSLVLVTLLITAYSRNKKAFSTPLFRLELNTRGKLCLLLPVIFPLMSIAGTRFLNATNNNTILLAMLLLIPLSIIPIVWQRHQISRDTYPIAIVLITVSLLMYYWLSSEHILGHDVHYEYYFFQNTSLNSHWSIIERSVLDSTLSISLLPAMFQSLLGVNAQEQLFKGIYTLISAFTPLSIYIISRKYLGELYAFLAAFFFIFHAVFLSAPGIPRVSVAIFFVALYIMVLLHPRIQGATRNGLLIAFMFTIITSHYSTTYIFFLLFPIYL